MQTPPADSSTGIPCLQTPSPWAENSPASPRRGCAFHRFCHCLCHCLPRVKHGHRRLLPPCSDGTCSALRVRWPSAGPRPRCNSAQRWAAAWSCDAAMFTRLNPLQVGSWVPLSVCQLKSSHKRGRPNSSMNQSSILQSSLPSWS